MKCCSGGVGDSGETDGVHRHLGREPLLHWHACSGPPPTGPASVQTPDLPVPNNHSDGGGFRCTGRGCGCVGGHNCHDCGGGGGGRTKAVQWQNITGRTKTMALRETAARLHARLAMQLLLELVFPCLFVPVDPAAVHGSPFLDHLQSILGTGTASRILCTMVQQICGVCVPFDAIVPVDV